jgi:hypothetical protein
MDSYLSVLDTIRATPRLLCKILFFLQKVVLTVFYTPENIICAGSSELCSLVHNRGVVGSKSSTIAAV